MDSQGHPVLFHSIDRVLLGWYQGLESDDLERQILDLELIATDLWEIPLDGGHIADLAEARHRDSAERFDGFHRTDGTWVFALTCSTCQNPAPVLLTRLEPGGGA